MQEFFSGVKFEREALFGHSFGGLFALHALFRGGGEGVWDVVVASSPSIWFGGREVLKRATEWARKGGVGDGHEGKKTRLFLSSGALEQNLARRTGESEEEFCKRVEWWAPLKMCDNAVKLEEVLKGCERLGGVGLTCFEDEDHSSVMGVAVGRAVSAVFGDGN